MAFMICSPLGGCMVDRVKHKKWLIGSGVCSSGVLMLCFYQTVECFAWRDEARQRFAWQANQANS